MYAVGNSRYMSTATKGIVAEWVSETGDERITLDVFLMRGFDRDTIIYGYTGPHASGGLGLITEDQARAAVEHHIRTGLFGPGFTLPTTRRPGWRARR
jgi:hypothetical protein